MPKTSFEFTFILSGIPKITRDVEDALFEAGCDDALLGSRSGVVFLDFDREANSLEDAIASALRDVKRAKIGARVERLEPNDFVTPAEIARRIGQSRESVRKYIGGQRGPGGFPLPVSIKGVAPIWRWHEVAGWFAKQGTIAAETATLATSLAAANNLLELERNRQPARQLISTGAFREVSANKATKKLASAKI